MGDIKLNPATGDLYIGPNGDLALTNDATGETTAQLIGVELKMLAGEWFLNTADGVDYIGTIFVKNPNLADVELHIKDRILAVTGVAGIKSYTQTFDRARRKLTVTGTVQEVNGSTAAFQEVLG